MLIEFAGCTGSGKSTFAVGVVERLRAAGLPLNDYCNRSASNWITARNAAVTPLWMLRLITSPGPALSHVRHCWSAIHRRTPSSFWRVARAAATVRLTGAHVSREKHLRRNRSAGIIDEGILTTVILAFSSREPASDREILALMANVPLPDVVVWVNAPLDALIERTRSRNDCPRELRGLSEHDLCSRLKNVQRAFETLVTSPRVAERLITVWNPPAVTVARESEIDRAAEAIRDRLDA